MIGPAEVARRLGVPLDFSPGVKSTWDGKVLHTSMALEHWDFPPIIRRLANEHPDGDTPYYKFNDVLWGYRIKQLDDVWLFHELAHQLLCPPERIKQKDYGFYWNPHTYDSHLTNPDFVNPPEHDQEENATEVLQFFMMLYCGYEEQVLFDLIRSYKKDPFWMTNGIAFEPIWEAWELFRLLMEES